ncbi:phosphoribosylglycinamide formyltransferase [bacterium]|jgi:phosphoribosylglycinamide formyltransferase 1|nr:phosphoribosylglycinamide formyltransferase [bacterium]
MTDRARLAVWASGSGTTLQNLIDRSRSGSLSAEIVLVLSDVEHARALQRAEESGIAHHHVPWKNASSATASMQAFEYCRRVNADWVVLAGFLKKVVVPDDFAGRIINVHPSLIPAFSGKGCYGHRVHEAAIARGVTISGCTVHFCDNEYDHGPIILQQAVHVLPNDTPDTLAHRVQEAEREALPEAINLLVKGQVRLRGNLVDRVTPLP